MRLRLVRPLSSYFPSDSVSAAVAALPPLPLFRQPPPPAPPPPPPVEEEVRTFTHVEASSWVKVSSFFCLYMCLRNVPRVCFVPDEPMTSCAATTLLRNDAPLEESPSGHILETFTLLPKMFVNTDTGSLSHHLSRISWKAASPSLTATDPEPANIWNLSPSHH